MQPPDWYPGNYGASFEPTLFVNDLSVMTSRAGSVMSSMSRSSESWDGPSSSGATSGSGFSDSGSSGGGFGGGSVGGF